MNRSNDSYQFYFKLAYTCQTKIYDINPNISIRNFIEDIRYRARYDFNIEQDEDIEIIEAGQPNNINGRDAELAPAIEPCSDYTIREIYGNTYRSTAFYIRKIPIVYTLNLPENIELNENEIPPPIRRGNS